MLQLKEKKMSKTSYTTVIFKDDQYQFYVGNYSRTKIKSFVIVNALDIKTQFDHLKLNEFYIIEMDHNGDSLTLTPMKLVTIDRNDNSDPPLLCELENEELLDLINESLEKYKNQ